MQKCTSTYEQKYCFVLNLLLLLQRSLKGLLINSYEVSLLCCGWTILLRLLSHLYWLGNVQFGIHFFSNMDDCIIGKILNSTYMQFFFTVLKAKYSKIEKFNLGGNVVSNILHIQKINPAKLASLYPFGLIATWEMKCCSYNQWTFPLSDMNTF
jgi:hypothetical protein